MQSARFQIREQRYLSCWSREFALAEGYGKIRRSSFGIKSRRRRPREFCLPNHRFNLKYLLQAGSLCYFEVVFASGGRHVTSRHPTLDTVGTRSRVIRRCTSKKRGTMTFDPSLRLSLLILVFKKLNPLSLKFFYFTSTSFSIWYLTWTITSKL